MAEINFGPGGFNVAGTPCANNTYLADQNNPLGALRDTLYIQRLNGVEVIEYPDMAVAVDRHQPFRASSASRVDNVLDYKLAVFYDNLLNSTQLTDVTPSGSNYTDTRKLLDQCHEQRTKGIASSVNGNAEACNPSVDGPVPLIGQEGYSRRGYVLRLPIPPICFASFANKEGFHDALAGVLRTGENGMMAAFASNRLKWQIAHSRFNISPVQQALPNGQAKLPVSPDLITASTFGRVPEHYGSFDWFASMLRLTEIPRRKNVTVELPAAVFERYKADAGALLGINVFEQAANLSQAINGFNRTVLQDSIIYTDRVTGRQVKFVSTTTPVYVEVQETGPNLGEWQFQEPTIARDSETSNAIMPRENPAYGVACSCAGKVLAAMVMVSVDGADKPFAMEPFPVNPDAGLRALLTKHGARNSAEVNTTLKEIYPTMVETRLFTGVEAQIWLLDPLNQKYRDAGWNCTAANNVEGTWVGGYHKMSGVFVEVNPRQFAIFMIRVPAIDNCVELFAPCADFAPISAAGEIEPYVDPLPKQVLIIPDPEPVPTPPAGTIFVVGNGKRVKAPCEGADPKSVSVKLVRRGGTAGSITINVAATESAHSGTIPATVTFADGETTKLLTWTIIGWSCADETATEQFNITFSGAGLDPDTTDEYPVCIQCTTDCVEDCGLGDGSCLSC